MKRLKSPIIIMRKKSFYAVALFTVMALGVNGQEIDGHEYVDLGLSVVWATCNVGANSPEECGDYYAWGEESTKSSFTTDNCKTWIPDGGEDIVDAFRDPLVSWGGKWRMPSEDEFRELIDSCTWTWTTKDGQNGYNVTSNKNGKSIFLPAAGRRDGESLFDDGEYGYYWSNSLWISMKNAYCLHFSRERHFMRYHYRLYNGFSVRGVAALE